MIAETAAEPARVLHQPGDRYVYTYSHRHEPIASAEPGERVTLVTLDAFADRAADPDPVAAGGRPTDDADPPPTHTAPLTGPLLVRGAEPGDGLRVHLHAIEPDRDFAVTTLLADVEGPADGAALRPVGHPTGRPTRIMPIEGRFVRLSDRIRLPYRPSVGSIGVAPFLEKRKAVAPDYFGGNMACVETAPGSTLILPVSHDGACFFIGDAHACRGEGGLTGVAAAIPARITVSFTLDKGKAPRWPRIESPTHLMVAGSGRPPEDASRAAWVELSDWLVEEHGFRRDEALMLMGVAGEIRLGNRAEPNYTMIAKIARAYLGGAEGL